MLLSVLTAIAVSAANVPCISDVAAIPDGYDMNITVNLGASAKEISPYIYGINQYANQENYNDVSVNAVRQGGNRMTAYNWETNASNAGSDWKFSSDNNLSSSDEPADCARTLSKEGQKYGFDYKLTTVQLAGYVAADKKGTVTEAEKAPSDRWNKVQLVKGSEFDAMPDLTDGVVYMDEYVNYIVNMLGNSTTPTGIQAYSLDNEPCLWHGTHKLIHPEPVGVQELSDKSIEMAAAIKSIDPHAEVFGPSLYGYTAFDHLADDDNSNEWELIKAQGNYHWYLDYYLDRMKQAEEKDGTRLLDVLDIHYYSESAKTPEDRLQSVRTLYEKGFAENSWIGQWCQENIPILPTIHSSIDKYYPGTKLAITEYSFGGGDVSGTIAQAEALGCYADADVYFASLWGGDAYQFAGINLYTNYDGNGGAFGKLLVPTKTDDVSLASSYASYNSGDKGTVTAMVTNKSFTESENASILLKDSDKTYESAAVYAVYGDSEEIRLIDIVNDVKDNEVNVTLPALSAAMVVITDDASDFDGLKLYSETETEEKIESFDNPMELINENGYVEIPIDDPEHLSKIIVTADLSSKMGSSWGSAGCAVCLNAVDAEGNKFWTSEGYSLNLGSGSTATIKFDGTLSNEDEKVEAVVTDGKVELQKWWDASEKQDDGDVISVTYKNVQVVYTYPVGEAALKGDVNADDKVSAADAAMLKKWLGGKGSLTNWKNGDICEDNIINAVDLCALKRLLLNEK